MAPFGFGLVGEFNFALESEKFDGAVEKIKHSAIHLVHSAQTGTPTGEVHHNRPMRAKNKARTQAHSALRCQVRFTRLLT